MTESPFYSDRIGQYVPRVSEEISANTWKGLAMLFLRRIDDGSLARDYPRHDCVDSNGVITGTDRARFLNDLQAYVPALDGSPLEVDQLPSTINALDVIVFVALHIDEPTRIENHSWGGPHKHYYFDNHQDTWDDELTAGQEKFREDVDLIFARNGVAFTLNEKLRVERLAPPEARPLISDFKPNTGDNELDRMLFGAVTRFLSRHPEVRQDALEKLWDAFERLKTLELGAKGDKKRSAIRLIERAAPSSTPFQTQLSTEFRELTRIGNTFRIRHHEHQAEELPGNASIDYLFIRLVSLIAFVLRQTGRMNA
ncbi:hypothetical protein [Haloechinothrix salitolerans]|uniref:Abortive infection C-terminus n=1 Tax=Haloechinothrix salitolerans TaxID=926830 RepID=A0ABW2BZQ8_9PSEU